jgi:hypothetical protein
MQRIHRAVCFTSILFAGVFAAGLSAWAQADVSPTGPTITPAIVIGFVGGYVHHDNLVHAEVQLAAHLSKEYPSGVHVEAFENHRGKQAHQKILQLLDADHDGSLSTAEKQQARIILYGHSWGGSESVHLARELEKDGIPVLLTIQVDSVAKRGQNDSVIPANVAQAANFYQPHGRIRGRELIRAADPASTRIIGNFRFDYKAHPIPCPHYPWWDRFFARPHTEIECDPVVWDRVESLIRMNLPVTLEGPAAADGSAQKPQTTHE